jgi:hypothetical protein
MHGGNAFWYDYTSPAPWATFYGDPRGGLFFYQALYTNQFYYGYAYLTANLAQVSAQSVNSNLGATTAYFITNQNPTPNGSDYRGDLAIIPIRGQLWMTPKRVAYYTTQYNVFFTSLPVRPDSTGAFAYINGGNSGYGTGNGSNSYFSLDLRGQVAYAGTDGIRLFGVSHPNNQNQTFTMVTGFYSTTTSGPNPGASARLLLRG